MYKLFYLFQMMMILTKLPFLQISYKIRIIPEKVAGCQAFTAGNKVVCLDASPEIRHLKLKNVFEYRILKKITYQKNILIWYFKIRIEN